MAAAPVPKLKQKLVIMMIIFGLLFALLALRLTQVMIIQGPEYQERAESQWTTRTSLTAQRGRIMDRNGLVLAQSGTSYRVLVNPNWIKADERVRIASELSDILGLDYEYVLERVSNTKRQQAQLKRKVSADVVAQIEALQFGTGVTFTTDTSRYYPMGQLFSQLVGFTGIDSEGQTGLEADMQEYLSGEDGLMVMETDRKGRPLSYGDTYYVDATDGYDVQLTVDAVAQSYLEKALEECLDVNRAQTVSGIVMDPATGEILAEATYPSFDLNNPPRDDVTSLMSMSRSRIATDTWEPGSIFKIITLAAALDSGTVTLDTTFSCDGSRTYGLEKIHCWRTDGHGTQTLTEAVENSCNCAFMEMAEMMGADTLCDYIYAFGLGVETESGIPSEDTGEVIHRKYIRAADLARISFGQSITVTGVQMANAACAAINGGELLQPHVVQSVTATNGTQIEVYEPTVLRRVIKSETSALIRQILQSVVDNGSGSNCKMQGYTVGGKTGTAQKYEEDGTASRTRLIASFIGFLPTDSPQLLCLLTVDEPQIPVVYGSTVAAPFVRKTFEDLVQYYGIQPTVSNEMREVPNVCGISAAEAIAALNDGGLRATVIDSEMEAIVTAQIPTAGSTAARRSQVVLYTTMTTFNDEGVYKEMVTVPDLLERRRLDAYDALIKLGLTLNYDRTACVGQIVSQSIEPGTLVEPGTEIYVEFYREPTKAEIKAAEDAAAAAAAAGAGGGGDGAAGGDGDAPTIG